MCHRRIDPIARRKSACFAEENIQGGRVTHGRDVFVSGGTGYIGGRLVPALLAPIRAS
jgi:FlaA1/EpsC-like NDP-sugar epimerase